MSVWPRFIVHLHRPDLATTLTYEIRLTELLNRHSRMRLVTPLHIIVTSHVCTTLACHTGNVGLAARLCKTACQTSPHHDSSGRMHDIHSSHVWTSLARRSVSDMIIAHLAGYSGNGVLAAHLHETECPAFLYHCSSITSSPNDLSLV